MTHRPLTAARRATTTTTGNRSGQPVAGQRRAEIGVTEAEARRPGRGLRDRALAARISSAIFIDSKGQEQQECSGTPDGGVRPPLPW